MEARKTLWCETEVPREKRISRKRVRSNVVRPRSARPGRRPSRATHGPAQCVRDRMPSAEASCPYRRGRLLSLWRRPRPSRFPEP
mgnify:CR=1 FL=1